MLNTITGSSNLYKGLAFLRICSALFGTGYIHPDEYFQNGEVIAGSILGVHNVITWEWHPAFPCRSIVPVWITTGLPLMLVGWVSRDQIISPRVIFIAERLSFLCLSFLLDYATYHLVYEPSRATALVLLGSSYVVHTYQVRPFSNSIEAAFVALSLVILRRMLLSESLATSRKAGLRYMSLLSFLTVCGLFTRITFGAFLLPVALEVFRWSLRQSRFKPIPWLKLLLPSALVASFTCFAFIYTDSAYFASPTRKTLFELTPLNFLRYNMLPGNLAEHGLHPRWLHLLVNLPMVATPGLLLYTLWAEWEYTNPRTESRLLEKDKRKLGVQEAMQRALYWLRWSSTTLLSIQPHQEPRFLVPLVAPMVAFVVNNGRILRAGRLFWIAWIASNVILGLLFGVLHQAGVVPSLFRVHDMIYDNASGIGTTDFHVVYWKTYMPPRHLLAVRQTDVDAKAVVISDHAGSPPESIARALSLPPASDRPLTTVLVTPFHAIQRFSDQARSCFTTRDRVFPHLDLDHIAEAVEVGFWDGLSLGIFDADVECLRMAISDVSM